MSRLSSQAMERRVWIPGAPRAQGSLRSFTHRHTGRIVTPQDRKVVAWRDEIRRQIRRDLVAGPVAVDLGFVLRGYKTVARKATSPPDLDKLVRAVLDALTGFWIEDDAQVVEICARKAVGAPGGEGVEIALWPSEAQRPLAGPVGVAP